MTCAHCGGVIRKNTEAFHVYVEFADDALHSRCYEELHPSRPCLPTWAPGYRRARKAAYCMVTALGWRWW